MAIASQIKEGRKRIQWEHRRENWKENSVGAQKRELEREFSGSTEERTGKRILKETEKKNSKD